MNFPDTNEQRLDAFPAVLRKLIEDELAAGNAIVEVGSSFPAPPAGAYVKLKQPITTRSREKTPSLHYYDRNSSLYSGEWTDAKRFFFVLEPPRPPPPEPDMNAIRAAHAATAATPPRAVSPVGGDARESDSLVQRFNASMAINYEKWHDGIGYDIALIGQANATEREQIERLLLGHDTTDWRDVEALAALDTPKARAALKEALADGSVEIRGAVRRYAPHLVSEKERIASLVDALRRGQIYGGISQALEEVAKFHPPEIIETLFWGVRNRSGGVAGHYAAMLMFIHGKTKQPFDWSQRAFFLRFNTEDSVERERLFEELCEKLEKM
jgi:hypothetical protein